MLEIVPNVVKALQDCPGDIRLVREDHQEGTDALVPEPNIKTW